MCYITYNYIIFYINYQISFSYVLCSLKFLWHKRKTPACAREKIFLFLLALPALSLNGADVNSAGFVDSNPNQNGDVTGLESQNGLTAVLSVGGNRMHSANIFQGDRERAGSIFLVDSLLDELSSVNVQHDFVPPKKFFIVVNVWTRWKRGV